MEINHAKTYEPDRFESINDFKQSLMWGKEIEFEWKGKSYVAFRFEGDGDREYLIGEAYKAETDVYFSSIEDVLNFKIDGQKLREFVTEVDVLDRFI